MVQAATGLKPKMAMLVASYTGGGFSQPQVSEFLEAQGGDQIRISVSIRQAVNLAKREMSNNNCDPYVRVQIGNQKIVSKTIKNDCSPQWKQTLDFKLKHISEATYVLIRVYDNDFTKGRDIGRVTIPLIRLARGHIEGWFHIQRKSKKQAVSGAIDLSIRTNRTILFQNEEKAMENDLNMAIERVPKHSFYDSKILRRVPGPSERVEVRLPLVTMTVYGLQSQPGTLLLTNFRLLFAPPKREMKNRISSALTYHPNAKREFAVSVPYNLLVEVKEGNASALRVRTRLIEITCKDFRKINFLIPHKTDPSGAKFNMLLKRFTMLMSNNTIYANLAAVGYDPPLKFDGWGVYDLKREYRRQGIKEESTQWRISTVNAQYEICESYPKLLVVPKAATDPLLRNVAKFRSKGRIPVCTWYHKQNQCMMARCAQPLVGLTGKQNKSDQHLFELIRLSTANNRGILIFDCRAAKANEIIGKGSENIRHYKNCKIMQGEIANIHAVRKSFDGLLQICNQARHNDEHW
eukprot:CAMPEP_0167739996 /NCGR_PEP_ID=MMETSP0110_2-20121227/30_1 /TAXON_ID=629695 /ORGANISM="Gymnochlora sp., Strain CCMP2014" /LENGTH=520 /DNA_ID=CAMNT_0007623837 /DNA_START=1 /DNA_END=1560 /DNA_ORIENTATION=+